MFLLEKVVYNFVKSRCCSQRTTCTNEASSVSVCVRLFPQVGDRDTVVFWSGICCCILLAFHGLQTTLPSPTAIAALKSPSEVRRELRRELSTWPHFAAQHSALLRSLHATSFWGKFWCVLTSIDARGAASGHLKRAPCTGLLGL